MTVNSPAMVPIGRLVIGLSSLSYIKPLLARSGIRMAPVNLMNVHIPGGATPLFSFKGFESLCGKVFIPSKVGKEILFKVHPGFQHERRYITKTERQ